VLRKQTKITTLLEKAKEAQEKMLKGTFPAYIQEQFIEMLDYFGQSPIIVRSSSLLEDAFGNAFSGKYESVFCANQGTREERLEAFMEAVRKVFSSTINREALLYREKKGLLDHDEQMALLVQRVSGDMFGNLFFPQISGVGFSFNPYVWNKEIDPMDGMLRLVFGLGTRAVDRHDDDYTRVVSLSAPNKRPETNFKEVQKYSQRKVDLLDLTTNKHTSMYFNDILQQVHNLNLELYASRDQNTGDSESGETTAWTLTFDGLFTTTSFIEDMKEVLHVLRNAYGNPVDIEFTINLLDDGRYKVNLVQCRPFQAREEIASVSIPSKIKPENLILRTSGPIIGNSKIMALDRIIYVDPHHYGVLPEKQRYSIARLIGQLTHLENMSEKSLLLIGPGRWGTSIPSLGIPVSFQEISAVSILCEVVAMHKGLVPDVSLGTHFFNDIVEMDMLYCAFYPNKKGNVLKEDLFLNTPNQLKTLLPDQGEWTEMVHVIDTADIGTGGSCKAAIDTLKQQGAVYRS
jgi:hypothetical protein